MLRFRRRTLAEPYDDGLFENTLIRRSNTIRSLGSVAGGTTCVSLNGFRSCISDSRDRKERAQARLELSGGHDLNIVIIIIIWMTILVLYLSFDSARLGLGVALGAEVGCRFD